MPEIIPGIRKGKLILHSFSHKGNKGCFYWKTLCDCGNERFISTGEWNRNRSPILSCGCHRPKTSIEGIKYGKLTPLNISHKANTKYHWLCRCDCGNEKTVEECSLKKGRTKSCGCLKHDQSSSYKLKAKERFLKRIKITHTCWEWKGSINSNGYGNCGMGYGEQSAHRASWLIHNGKIPKGMYVLHKCDNKICCNPHHLYIGTAKENSQDAVKRGQHPIGPNKKKGSPGERNAKAKLNEEKVLYIKFLCEEGFKKTEIANFFKVHASQIKNINSGKSWGYLWEK